MKQVDNNALMLYNRGEVARTEIARTTSRYALVAFTGALIVMIFGLPALGLLALGTIGGFWYARR